MEQDIIFSKENHIGLITLNRPKALNALTFDMITSLQNHLIKFSQDDEIHAIVIQAGEGRAFCAGGDIRWLYETGKKQDPTAYTFFNHEYSLNYYINNLQKPYIALMNGLTMGGGVGISLHGSHPVASEFFKFAMPETSIGFFPDIGSSYLLNRCINNSGIYLGLTGNQIGASDACWLGLVKYFVPANQFDNLLSQLINTDLSENAHSKVDACLKHFSEPLDKIEIRDHISEIDACFGYDSMELIIAELKKSDSIWRQQTLATLEKKSPLSLKVTLMQLKKANSMSLGECLNLDYCLVKNFIDNHDFYEGVRALIVDKDRAPNWQPNKLSLVNSSMVEKFFVCEGCKLNF